ncbi:DUF305 domain-containing protein [Streptomyces bambusae]|uniref:DUF305 domain-containing protein n=1 Tax=Streptomyces bambusae TaxID=1550616 RepID=A0ABS6Z805_9ACTN|nr:DUF305 domain-containing protein [Streptomyces bambusae]
MLFAAVATVATATGSGTAEDGGAAHAAAAVPGTGSADAGFARDMAVHHQQAVEMSFIVRDRTQDEAVRTLAYDIANTQANQRGMMLGWLDLWGLPKVAADREPMAWMAEEQSSGSGSGSGSGHAGQSSGSGGHAGHGGHSMGGVAAKPGALMPGMATKEELAQLSAAGGRDAEVLFLQLMTDHHKGGVAMAQACATLCRTPVERDLAQGMVDAQQSEITLMADMLRRRGAAPRG